MISTLSGLIFIISVVAFIVFLIWGFVKNQHINQKTWLWLLLAVVAIVVYVTTAKTPETANSAQNVHKTAKSNTSKQPVDDAVVAKLKAALKSGDMVTFLKTFYAQDKQKHLAYYQKADVATTKTTIKGQVIEPVAEETDLYLYVPVEEMPANVRNTKQKAYVVVINDPNNDLKNYSVGQTAEVTGYLVGHGDKKHGYSWELNVAK
ncbi:hypothetical protein [Leuconostoc lactis]|uniref:hypothetical protein n=1 Tax=Leuconostoc lactis TaxID=1246 RepID=UPI0006DC723A|nr:hypothetical protein [Leuconostoc lactis]KQB82427.1 hypothetical protein AN225_02910 [Leuconostoc lactis]QEA48120.1 hypothetical protein FGL80_07920 [Leuconostoc lactis]